MREIKLTQGKVTIVDDEDYERLNQHKWCARKAYNTYYVRRGNWKNGRQAPHIIMHREIMKVPDGMEIDHIDGNGLNNQKSNLRICTHKENTWNSRPYSKNTSSRFKGVHWCNTNKRWIAKIYINGKNKYIGSFLSEYNAAISRDNIAIKLCGDFAKTNLLKKGS